MIARIRKREPMQGRAQRRDGFTLIEVMMAIAIMTVGAVGIMALQQAATRGNAEARQLTTGTELTRTWLERIRRDSLRWTASLSADGTALQPTSYLRNLPPVGTTGWITPIDLTGAESYAFDYLGNDTTIDADKHYCTHLRMTWIVVGDTARVEARTFWPKRGNAGVFDDCSRGSEVDVTNELAAAVPRLQAVYAATLVRWTPLQ